MQYFFKAFKNYANFKGRAHRTDYWMFVLIYFIINTAIMGSIYAAATNGNGTLSGALSALSGVFGLVLFIPSLSIFIRRLHDTNRSGW